MVRGGSKKCASRYHSRQLKFSRRLPFSRFSAHLVNTACKRNNQKRSIPVHMHERLSASTDFRPVRPDVAKDRRGAGNVLTGICNDGFAPLTSALGIFAVEWDSLRCIPSTKVRNLSSGEEGKSPLSDWRSTWNAVGRYKARKPLKGKPRI